VLFEVLPQLPIGIYVHFHDILETFEYPEEWLLGGRYWNGAYFPESFEKFLEEKLPLCLKDIGASLYIRRVS